jgi:hypothetical protein
VERDFMDPPTLFRHDLSAACLAPSVKALTISSLFDLRDHVIINAENTGTILTSARAIRFPAALPVVFDPSPPSEMKHFLYSRIAFGDLAHRFAVVSPRRAVVHLEADAI